MDLNDFRNRISEIDNQIIELFVERMRTAAKIAEAKSAQNLPILDSSREKAVLRHVKEKAGTEQHHGFPCAVRPVSLWRTDAAAHLPPLSPFLCCFMRA